VCVTRSQSLVIVGGGPEEGAVFDDRPTETAAVKVVVGVGLWSFGFPLEEELRRSERRSVLEDRGPVPIVAARFSRRVEDSATGAPHLSVIGADLHAPFLPRFDVREEARAVAQISDRDAVNRVIVGATRPAAEREQRRIGLILLPHELWVARRHDARRRDRKEEDVARRGGQFLQRPGFERRRD